MAPDIHSLIALRLQDSDVRYTPHRRTLVDLLARAERPLTIPQIVAAPDAPPQSSVYRNLTVFEEAGVVHRFEGHGDFARFELAEDLMGHHHHLVCQDCGSVTDFELPVGGEEALQQVLTAVARQKRFTVANHRLDLLGRCAQCSRGAATPRQDR